MAKVLLGAVCTYQLVYYLWVKLEAEETKEMKNGAATPKKKVGSGYVKRSADNEA